MSYYCWNIIYFAGICHITAGICHINGICCILVQMAEPVEELVDEGSQPKKAVKMMTWTPPMSACLLKCLAHIAAKGVKTDKGFKEIHITKAAKDVTQLVGYEVTTTQVTNHLRKWKTRWQKIDKLRTLSGALWDDESKMIVLADQHYLEHVQVCTYLL
jgi:hypothetical protein